MSTYRGSNPHAFCLDAGARVLAADIDEDGLGTLTASDRLHCTALDIGNSAAVERAINAWAEKAGRIDAAVITSAVQKRAPIEETSDEDWHRHLQVNLTGVFHLIRCLMPIMKHQRAGSIVAFTSGLATNGWPGAAAYAASKAGIVGLVKCAALELRPFGVRVNALSPGLVATPVFLNSASDEELAMYERTVGVSAPDEVVPSIMHLISDASATISGTVVERRLIPRAPGRE